MSGLSFILKPILCIIIVVRNVIMFVLWLALGNSLELRHIPWLIKIRALYNTKGIGQHWKQSFLGKCPCSFLLHRNSGIYIGSFLFCRDWSPCSHIPQRLHKYYTAYTVHMYCIYIKVNFTMKILRPTLANFGGLQCEVIHLQKAV